MTPKKPDPSSQHYKCYNGISDEPDKKKEPTEKRYRCYNGVADIIGPDHRVIGDVRGRISEVYNNDTFRVEKTDGTSTNVPFRWVQETHGEIHLITKKAPTNLRNSRNSSTLKGFHLDPML